MKKPLALFDIDKTMYSDLSYFPLLDAQVEEGLVAAGYASAANKVLAQYENSDISYEDFVKKLIDIYATCLAEKNVDKVSESTNNFFNKDDGFFGYVKPTVDLLAFTHELVLVTGGTQFTAAAVAKKFGISKYCSTVLEVQGSSISGRVESYLSTRHEKRDAIRHLTEAYPYKGSFAFGDSEGDIEMLQVVEYPVCIKPSKGLQELAKEKGWTIINSAEELSSQEGLKVVKAAIAHN